MTAARDALDSDDRKNEVNLARLLAAGYLRLLAQRAAGVPAGPPAVNPPKPVDSLRDKSMNWVELEGGRDA